MQFKSVIARQLHKRMSHHFIQASIAHPYSINLSTIIRDFGLTKYEKISNNLREAEKGLQELKTSGVALNYEVRKTYDIKNKNKIVDAQFTITPDPRFVNEVMKSNQKVRRIENAAG